MAANTFITTDREHLEQAEASLVSAHDLCSALMMAILNAEHPDDEERDGLWSLAKTIREKVSAATELVAAEIGAAGNAKAA